MNIFTQWGSTPEDRKLPFTCDTLLREKNDEYFRAVNISAPADLVYRWICQMKVAPYSYDKLDNGGKQSPQHLTPGIDKLKIGDKMMTIFHVEHYIPNEEITLVMDVPPANYAKWYVPTVITYKIIREDKHSSRVVVKYIANWPKTFFGQLERLFIIVADFIMMRRQLLNFKKLAERDYAENMRRGRFVYLTTYAGEENRNEKFSCL
jgi:hypothetical protein